MKIIGFILCGIAGLILAIAGHGPLSIEMLAVIIGGIGISLTIRSDQ